jgi:hypothetical protein
MAEVQLAPTLEVQRWRKEAITEYIRQSRFKAYTGKNSNSIIQIATDLEGKAGNIVHIPMVFRIQGAGVSGAQVLVGNEAEMTNADAVIQTDWVRNGIVVPKSVSFKTDLDLMRYGKDMLRGWFSEMLRDSIIREMASVIVPGVVTADNTGMPIQQPDVTIPFMTATAVQQNAYLSNNYDRILFGSKLGNQVTGNMAASLANVTPTYDRMSSAVGNLAKRLAKRAGGTTLNTALGAGPHMRPYLAPNGGQEFYVMFCDTNSFRDIAADPAVIQANINARAREGSGMDKNPIFQDGDLLYRGVIYVEFPELDSLTLVGAANGGGNISCNFLCGAQALGLAYTEMLTPKVDTRYDYEFRPRAGFEECRGQKKMSYLGKSLGVLPVYTYSYNDA